MMNKRTKVYTLVWAILLVIFNIICFVTPNQVAGLNKFDGAFWAGYIFITIAFIGQLVCACIALKAENNQKLFYNIPIIRISYIGLILTLIFGGVCMIIPNLPNWVGIIICLIILAFTAMMVVKAKATADIVERIDRKTAAQIVFVKSLTADAESLLVRAETPEAKEACKKVLDAIRYSDPVSSDALSGIETQITLKFSEFSNAVASKSDAVANLADEVVVLIGDRNKRCKLAK